MSNFSAKKTFINIRNFLAGRFVGATRDEFLLEEIVKLIFCKNSFLAINTSDLDDIELSSLYRKEFKKVIADYPDIYHSTDTEIELDPVSIKFIDEQLNQINLFDMKRDIIGDAYEIFIGESIKGQSGQFFTPKNVTDALVKIVQPANSARVLDLTCGAGGFLVSTLKYWNENNTKPGKVFGVDKDQYLTKLAKIHIALLGQDTNNISNTDSLVWDEQLLGKGENSFDIVLTNPPFGTNINAGTVETLKKYDLGYKYKKNKEGSFEKTFAINESVAPQVVFLEKAIRLVKKGGILGIVVPESMISNKKYAYVVDYILDNTRIRAILGMPDDLFKTSGKGGTHTKTCLLVLEKDNISNQKNYEIFMAETKWCGHDSRGREIPNDDIPIVVENYLEYLSKNDCNNQQLGFVIKKEDIKNNVLAPRAYVYSSTTDQFDFGEDYNLVPIEQLVNDNILEIKTGNEVGKLAYGTGHIPFIRTSDISNWEIKSDPKHLISKEYFDSLHEKQDVREGDILMVKDGSYLIGTCALVTNLDTNIVYQSHLYKIRVFPENVYGIDNYYLIAILSSEFLRQQIVSNTFSHDIINSLGDRIKDLIIPIPKSKKEIRKISSKVQLSIKSRIKSKLLQNEVKEMLF
ncbi:TPA: N-6 DNA methylase [Streptococcus suis]